MIVGAAVVELHVHDSQSLKAKRGIVRSIMGRLEQRFRLSVAEVGGQNTWQRAVLGFSVVGIDSVHVQRKLEQAVNFVEELHLAEVMGSDIELMQLPFESKSWDGENQ